MEKRGADERTLSVAAFSCLFAYLLSFVFEGRVLYSLLNQYDMRTDVYVLSAVSAHFAGLFSCGYFVDTRKRARQVLSRWSAVIIAVTAVFFFPPSVLWLICLIVSGFISGCAVASWGFYLKASTSKNERYKTCADVLIFSNLIMILINTVAERTSAHTGLALSTAVMLIGIAAARRLPAAEQDDEGGGRRLPVNLKTPMLILFLFISVITVNSGLMYQVINPAFEHLAGLVSWYWAVPYIAAIAVMKGLPPSVNRSVFLYVGMGMMMAAFICFMLLGRDTAEYIAVDTLMLGACGIFDLFWWSIIGEMLEHSGNPARVFGMGLSANVFGVLCGDVIGMAVRGASLSGSEVAVIALCIVCVTLVLLPPLNGQLNLLLKSHIYLAAYSRLSGRRQDQIIKQAAMLDPLTARENEVLRLVLLGRSNRDISEDLYISENTVKTHLRSIYSKYAVGSRAELISTLLKNQNGS